MSDDDNKNDERAIVPMAVAKVLPLHELGQLQLKRGPGRPRKVEKRPTTDDLVYHAQISTERDEFVRNHQLVIQNTPKGTGTSAVDKLNLIKFEIAKETAVLEFNRMELEKRGHDTSQISSRIIGSLRQIADIELEIKKLGHAVIDPRSEEVQNIFRFWVEAVKGVTKEMVEEGALTAQSMDLFYSKFAARMEGWEDKVSE